MMAARTIKPFHRRTTAPAPTTISGGILAIGSELLLDGYPETNSVFLAEGLGAYGVRVRWKMIVGDNVPDIAEALRIAVQRAQVVVVTGGLGSTVDDCTREAVAQVTGCPLRTRPSLVRALIKRYGQSSTPKTPAILRQACVPEGATVLPNPVGSAPGFALNWRNAMIVVLPGVPQEVQAIFNRHVIPLLRRHFACGQVMKRHVFHTFGLPELDVQALLEDVMRHAGAFRFGFLPSPFGVTVLVTCWEAKSTHEDKHEAVTTEHAMNEVVEAVRLRLGDYLYAEGTRSMEEVVGDLLVSQSLGVAVAESCTGGLIGHRLTNVPGSSRYVDRVLVTYSNEAKRDLLGVPDRLLRRYGAVSAQVAEAMAQGIRRHSRCDVGLSVTGIAGPSGGSSQKPVGLVFVGLDGAHGCSVRSFQFHGDRQTVKLRASQGALDHLRRYLVSRVEAHAQE